MINILKPAQGAVGGCFNSIIYHEYGHTRPERDGNGLPVTHSLNDGL